MPQKKGHSATPTSDPAATAPEVPDHLLKDVDLETTSDAKPLKKAAAKTKSKTAKAENPPAVEADSTEQVPAASDRTANLDDAATEQAVNDIAVDEADTMLTLQDVATEPLPPRKSVLAPLLWVLLIIVVAAAAAVPATRQTITDFFTQAYHSVKAD